MNAEQKLILRRKILEFFGSLNPSMEEQMRTGLADRIEDEIEIIPKTRIPKSPGDLRRATLSGLILDLVETAINGIVDGFLSEAEETEILRDTLLNTQIPEMTVDQIIRFTSRTIGELRESMEDQ